MGTPFGSLTSACTTMGWLASGFSGANVTFEITGGKDVEKLALALPGVPAGLIRSSDNGEEAQLAGSSPRASGQIRSSEPERPSAPAGQGGRSWYSTLSTTRPAALENSSRWPLLLKRCSNTPPMGTS